MRKLLPLLILFAASLTAQNSPLKFKKDGSFKIVQFTDNHYIHGNPESDVAVQLIEEVLQAEKPDLVVFTGDVIFKRPALPGLDAIFDPVAESGIPFAYVLGNHDDEYGYNRQEVIKYVMQKPNCLASMGDSSLFGAGNYTLEIKQSTSDNNGFVLYFFDTGSYSQMDGIKGADWIKFEQVQWYRQTSKTYTKANAGIPYPAMAFFHIPLQEYYMMAAVDKKKIIGERRWTENYGKLNTGLYAAMKYAGDVMATFVGHDHDNDYVGDYNGICLGYGRYSGGNTVVNNLGANGCRVIELKEGERSFSTHIRLLGGEVIHPVSYPDTLIKE